MSTGAPTPFGGNADVMTRPGAALPSGLYVRLSHAPLRLRTGCSGKQPCDGVACYVRRRDHHLAEGQWLDQVETDYLTVSDSSLSSPVRRMQLSVAVSYSIPDAKGYSLPRNHHIDVVGRNRVSTL